MLQRLTISNFRGFRVFEGSLLGLTAFLGPNSSGKTSVLQAVRFACDGLRLAMDADRAARLDDENQGWIVVADGALVDASRLFPWLEWRAAFVDQSTGEGTQLAVGLVFEEVDPIQEIRAELVCARNEQLKLTVRVRAAAAAEQVNGLPRKSGTINRRITEYLREHAPVAVMVPPFYGTVRDEEYRTQAVVDRLLGAGDQSHVVRNLVVGLEPAQWERLNAFLQDTVGARLTSRTGADEVQKVTRLRVQFRDTNGELELSAAGAGLVNLVALYTSLSRWRLESRQRRVIFLLDEPEAHLHPRLQADTVERLHQLVTQEFGAQLLLATHSVDILNRVSAVGGLLVRCDRSAVPSAVELRGDNDLLADLAGWADLAPFTAINALASRRILFCEGDSDQALLLRLAELRFRNDPTRLTRFRRWATVRLHGASHASLPRLLARLVEDNLIVAQAAIPGGFRVALLLDRDYDRAAGTMQEVRGQIVENTTVWSRHSIESLFVEPQILTSWIAAFVLPENVVDLAARVNAAIQSANSNGDLNARAMEQLCSKMATGTVRDDTGNQLGGEQKIVHAIRRSSELVESDPATWQRGKDRARHVLGYVREQLPVALRNRFPTDLVQLITRTNLDRIGNPLQAIPAEIGTFLDGLVAE